MMINRLKSNKTLFGIILLGIMAFALPITLLLIQDTQDQQSSAATPDKLETEAGVFSSTGVTKMSDSNASGGQFVRFSKSTSGPTPTSPPNFTGTGTGGTYKPAYVSVTGGGAMPSTSGGISVQDYGAKGDGATDDTSSIQNAANAAKNAGKVLLIPKTNSFYKISTTINIYTSVIGINGMPVIKQTNGDHGWFGAILFVRENTSGWIYNLHLIGQYNGEYFNYRDGTGPNGQDAALIRLGAVNGFTIKGNLLENPWGDGIYDTGMNKTNPGKNILIDNNTFKNSMRCAIGVTRNQDGLAIMNNKIIHSSYFVNPIDFEPDYGQTPYEFLDGWIVNAEIAYNEYQITSPYEVNEFTGWFDPTPGGNIWVHNNYGSWIGEFTHFVGLKGAPSAWFNTNVWSNTKTN